MRLSTKPGNSCAVCTAVYFILAALIIPGLLACGGGSTDTSGTRSNAESLEATGGDLVIGAALLDPDSGNVLIDGRNFTGGYEPLVTLDGTALTVTSYTPTEIRADYNGPSDPSGALLLTVQKGPDIGDRDSDIIAIGDVDPADPVSHNQLVIWNMRVEVKGGAPFLMIMGNNFDNGTVPAVYLGDTSLWVAGYNAWQIECLLPDTAALTEGAVLSVQTGTSLENYDAYDLNVGDDSSQVPPSGDCYPCWTEGPEDTNLWHGGSVWYEPLYYQLEHDYVVDMASFFTDKDRLPLGHKWRRADLHDYIVNDFPATAVTWFGWDYIVVEPGGILTIKKGYRWDGPTTSPLPYSSRTIHASMVHDAIYDLMRMGHIDRDYKPFTVAGFKHRLIADCLLFMISKDDGRRPALALSDFKIVRAGGWRRTNASMPGWKEHAVAEAGPDQDNSCGIPGSETLVELDGSFSRHARSWIWEENGTQAANGAIHPIFLPPGLHNLILTADDPYAEARDLHHYADTDDVVIDISIDVVPPDILVPDDTLTVPNDPGECSAVVQLDVTATDDCGESQVICDPSSGSPFPVGTTNTTCTAVDAAGNTDTGSFDVTVQDVEPPVINYLSMPMTQWPPNHKYVTFAAADLVDSVTDNCDDSSPVGLVITGAAGSETDNDTGVGDGSTTEDIVIVPDGGSVQLRAERQGTGSGRTYTIMLEATDGWGNTAAGTVEVVVPHSYK
jgi:hypothetical protein